MQGRLVSRLRAVKCSLSRLARMPEAKLCKGVSYLRDVKCSLSRLARTCMPEAKSVPLSRLICLRPNYARETGILSLCLEAFTLSNGVFIHQFIAIGIGFNYNA